MSRRCQALTKKGQPCQGGAMVGSRFCGPHTDFPAGRPDDTAVLVGGAKMTVAHMDWEDPECVKGYMDEMDRISRH